MVTIKSSNDFEYRFFTPKMKNQWAATQWCEEQFGKRWSVISNRDGVWCCFWRGRSLPESYEWYFQNEKDALLFSLKWI